MSSWLGAVSNDLSQLPACIAYFENELKQAKFDVSLKGKTLEKHAAELPGISENRFSQLQEIESILAFLNIKLEQKRSEVFVKLLEGYKRALSSRDAEKYSNGNQEVVDLLILINEFALIRNKYLAITKGLEQKSWMIGHITRLRCAGLDEFSMN